MQQEGRIAVQNARFRAVLNTRLPMASASKQTGRNRPDPAGRLALHIGRSVASRGFSEADVAPAPYRWGGLQP